MGVTLTDVLLFGKAQSDDVDNATLVIYRRNILRWSALGGYLDVIVKGVAPLSLPDAIANSLSYVKAFGGCEQRNLPEGYIERQFIYMMDGSYLLTDIVPTYDCKIEMDFQTTSIISQAATYLSSSTALRFAHISAKTFRVNAWGDTYDSTTFVADNTRYKFIYDNLVATLKTGDTTVFTNTFTDTGTITIPLTINGYGSPVSQNVEGIYLYSFKVWNGQGELVIDLVPAIQKGTVPVVGFYDTVSKTFKTATAGTFAAGGEAVPTPDTPMDIVSNNGVLKARHQSGLPLGYTLLDYIESSGTQYIDTGMRIGSTDNVVIDVSFNGENTGACFGAFDGSSWQSAGFFVSDAGGELLSVAMYSQTSTTYQRVVLPIDTANKKYHIVWEGNPYNGVTIDGVYLGSGTTQAYTPTHNFYLFARNNAGTASSSRSIRVYNFEVEEKIHLIPAKRNSDNEIGMYDTVSGTFFTNQGTGDFVAGSPVSDPVEIYTDGTVETIGVHGGNLIDLSAVTDGYYYDPQGNYTALSSARLTDYIPIETGKDVKIYFKSLYSLSSLNVRINIFNSSKVWQSQEVLQLAPETDGTKIVTPTNDGYIRVSGNYSGGAIVDWNTASITESLGTATAEMLLKVGDYQDVQSIIDGVVTRKVGVKVLDGTENWSVAHAATYAYTMNVSDAAGQSSWSNLGGLCSHLSWYVSNTTPTYTDTNPNTLWFNSSRDLRVKTNSNFATLTDWTNYLKAQYAAGTPVIVIYPLATPTTESVAGQTLQVTDGDNTLEITQASLNGLELEAKYQAAVSLTIQEVQDANLDPNVEVTIN